MQAARRLTRTRVDLSAGGVLLASGSFAPNTGVRFSLALETGQPPVDGHARVVRVTEEGRLALTFEQVSVDDHEQLSRCVQHRQAVLA